MKLDSYPLESIAARVGTPFYLYDADILRAALGRLTAMASHPNLVVRYAMKANSARAVLKIVREAGLWIDAVSGNEVLRAARAGFPLGSNPPVIMLTSDVYRDNSLEVVLRHGVMPNVGSPGQIAQLAAAGYRGPIAMRTNPGFGHGHVRVLRHRRSLVEARHLVRRSHSGDARTMAAAAGLKDRRPAHAHRHRA
jgi:diaminopimelate decarboxylase